MILSYYDSEDLYTGKSFIKALFFNKIAIIITLLTSLKYAE
jgi:hypothetical protein